MTLDFSNLGPSLIRTLVPYLVGLAATLGVTQALHLSTGDLTAVLTLVVGYGYYVIVRLLEHQWPVLGVFLGIPQPPVYTPAPTVVSAAPSPVSPGTYLTTNPPQPGPVTVAPSPIPSPVDPVTAWGPSPDWAHLIDPSTDTTGGVA